MRTLRLTVNGRPVTADVEPRTHLADFLRESQLLTGTHLGCEHGVCGACTLLIDGAPARSCITYALACEGAEITTIEGLDDDVTRALRAAFSRGIVPGIEVEWSDVQGETSYYLTATNLLTGIGRPIATDLPANTTLFLDQDAIFEEGTILYELRACNDFGCSDAAFVEVK